MCKRIDKSCFGNIMFKTPPVNNIDFNFIISYFISEFGIFENKPKKKGKTPLVDISLLKNHNLKTGMGIRLITNLSLAGALFAVSVFLQSVLHLSAFMSGLTLLPSNNFNDLL